MFKNNLKMGKNQKIEREGEGERNMKKVQKKCCCNYTFYASL